jgi:uncharacterized membrane protein YbhN (UPF0104 family)
MSAVNVVEANATDNRWSHGKRWGRILTLVFLCIVIGLVTWQAQRIEWSEVWMAMRGYKATTLALASALSALSYLAYSCFDLLGRRYAKVNIKAAYAMRVAFISYAFNQSFGALLGAIAFRVRMYLRHGLKASAISKMIALSVVTNWLGYAALAGMVFAIGTLTLPQGWDTRQDVLRIMGVAFMVSTVVYFFVCARFADREIGFRRWRFRIPHVSLAGMQLLLSSLHWPLTAMILYVLFDGRVDFMTVIAALFLNAVAVVITHIPAGLGVMEAIFIGLLHHRIPSSTIVGALMVFRAVYYLAPLALAALLYLRTEVLPARHEAASR